MSHENSEWALPDKIQNWEQVNAALLMDIRRELQALNRIFHCRRFLAIPTTLKTISRNTHKRRKKTKR